MHSFHILCLILSIISAIGAINWLFTAYDLNLVEKITKDNDSINKIIYTVIGICGIFSILCQIKWIMS